MFSIPKPRVWLKDARDEGKATVRSPRRSSRRRHYRSSASRSLKIKLQDDPRRLPFEVRDTSAGGLSAVLRSEFCPFEPNDRVPMHLIHRRSGDRVSTEVEVRHIEPSERGFRIGFQFVDSETLYRQFQSMSPTMLRLFNRRRVRRLVPPQRYKVKLDWDDDALDALSGRLKDLSIYGAGVTIKRRAKRSYPGRVTLRFALGRGQPTLSVVSRLRHISSQGRGALWGFQFDRNATPDFEDIEGALARFVLQHSMLAEPFQSAS